MNNSTKAGFLLLVLSFSCHTNLLAQEEQLSSLNSFIENLIGNHKESNVKNFESINEACESEFVTCDENQHLIALDFQYCNLNGFISDEVIDLKSLESINLEFNYLYGNLPDGLENLEKLEKLLLTGNFLSGEVPDSLRKLSKKIKIDLSKNAFIIDDEYLVNQLNITDQIDLEEVVFLDSFLLKNREDSKMLDSQRLQGIDEYPRPKNCRELNLKSVTDIPTYVQKNIKYPTIARKNGLEKTVFVRFHISKDGQIKGRRILQDTGERYGNAVLWAINRLNYQCGWTAGKYKDNNIDTPLGFSIKFKVF